MRVDFKVTAWERVRVHPDAEEKVLMALKGGKIKTANDLWDYAEDDHLFLEGILPESEVYLSPEENGGFNTIEAMDDDDETDLYHNGKY